MSVVSGFSFQDASALVVDQESLLMLELSVAFQDAGCASVLMSKSPAHAGELIRDDAQLDFAVIELAIGNQSALPLARRLLRRGTRVVLTSAGSGRSLRMRAFAHLPIVEKPYLIPDILALLASGRSIEPA